MTTPGIQKSTQNLQQIPNLQTFTLNELKQVIKQLNPHKAPGSDLITALTIQEMPPEGLQTLLNLFNSIARLEYWPAPLKHAMIIMIPKPGKTPTDVATYRPISLLPVISKILEKLLLKSSNYTEAAAICSAAQQHSTFTVQILYILYSLQLNCTYSNYTEAAATCSAAQQHTKSSDVF